MSKHFSMFGIKKHRQFLMVKETSPAVWVRHDGKNSKDYSVSVCKIRAARGFDTWIGREMDETILASVVIGNAVGAAAIPKFSLPPWQTLASLIAKEFRGAVISFHTPALIGRGLVLLMLTKVINISSRLQITGITRIGPDNRKRAIKRQEITTKNTQQKIRRNSSSSHRSKIRTSRDMESSLEIDNNADDDVSIDC